MKMVMALSPLDLTVGIPVIQSQVSQIIRIILTMPLHKVKGAKRTDTCCILIPFHHREDLLIPLLKHLKQFWSSTIITQSDWSYCLSAHPHLNCVRTKGNSGFTKAVNFGLHRVENLGFMF